jgi:pantetheine-phosphate adenylyltransferase
MRFNIVALGGTFDIIHKGHIALLTLAFSISKYVIIGVSSDKFAIARGKGIINNYDMRINNLKNALKNYDNRYTIIRLDDDFGPALHRDDIEALIVSKETEEKGRILNRLRKEHGLKELEIIVIDMVLASDGKPISSTRIKRGEIDTEGNLRSF